MSEIVFSIILFAALLHATWNAVVKSAPNKYLTTVLVTGTAALWALVLLPFFPVPSPQSWPFIAGSVILQIIYFVLLAKTYQIADMSQAYPLMRGSAPLIVALSSIVLFNDQLNSMAWGGIIILCIGILFMLCTKHTIQGKTLILALSNAVVIASYTLLDAIGARYSGSAIAYSLWIFLLTGLWMLSSLALNHQTKHWQYLKKYWYFGILGGICTIGSYTLALWAMTQAPVAMIAALRESSILFALIIAIFVLKEKVGLIRLLSAGIIVLGILILRLA
ncbi:SMR family transporter [Acinetobacter rudis]|uniref:SMR family transporter n=1 Tax=Acinetobacter rudis TaxID=632955 RepID=A0AAW8J6W8_9GAMM|nr:SMR family transporter [Acinetobacter rudis]MDQ8934315.1 SMR family transporter [Acinetobacter rudis]MDQ8952563.1 SMR family transporter [Acinetobacter rudis]MDQ9016377.1 SMR family transporter [Acinetobacter rudis]